MKLYCFLTLPEFNRICHSLIAYDGTTDIRGLGLISPIEYEPEYALYLLSKLIPEDARCFEFEVDNREYLIQTNGIYKYAVTRRNPNLKPVRYGIINKDNTINWHSFN